MKKNSLVIAKVKKGCIECPDGRIKTKYPDGRIETEDTNGWVTTKYPDGSSLLETPKDGFIHYTEDDGKFAILVYDNGLVVTYYPDETCLREYPLGYPIGIAEGTEWKEWEYPDGTTYKTEYPDDGAKEFP